MPGERNPVRRRPRILVVSGFRPEIRGLGEPGEDLIAIGAERPLVPAGWETWQARELGEYRDAETVYVAAAEEADTLIKRWAGARTSAGTNLDEETSYEGASLWQAVEFNLLYGHLAAWIDELRLWDRIFEVENPRRLLLPPGEISRAPRLIAASRGIESRELGGPGSQPAEVEPGRPWWQHLPPPLAAGLRRWRSRARSSRAQAFNRAHGGGSPTKARADRKGRRILVLTVVRRFAEVSVPVIRSLTRDPTNEVLVIDRSFSTATPRLERECIPFRVLEGYADKTSRQVHHEQQRRFRRAWRRLESDMPFQRQLAWRDVSLWPILRPVLAGYFDAMFPELARVIAVTRNLLRAERPDVSVITDERPPFQRAFVMACRMEGIPTVGIQDTLFPNLPYGSPISTDWLAIEGQVAKSNLTRRGTTDEKLVITGQPRFDFIPGLDASGRTEGILDSLGWDTGRKTILVVSQYAGIYFRPDDKRRIFKAIYEQLSLVSDIQVIVKLHPDDNDGSIERELAQQSGISRWSVVRDGDMIDYLLASDLVIVFFSTVGHEAILLGKPLIQIPVGSGEGTIIPFTEEGGALDGTDLTRLADLVRAGLSDSRAREGLRRGREAYIERHVHALDGHAADRVAELIVRAAQRRKE